MLMKRKRGPSNYELMKLTEADHLQSGITPTATKLSSSDEMGSFDDLFPEQLLEHMPNNTFYKERIPSKLHYLQTCEYDWKQYLL